MTGNEKKLSLPSKEEERAAKLRANLLKRKEQARAKENKDESNTKR